MLADYHVHSAFSDDSFYDIDSVVKDAAAMGLDEICFTEHVDYGVKPDRGSGEPVRWFDGKEVQNVDYPLYVDTVHRLQKARQGKPFIKLGLEFGMQVHTIPQYEALFAGYPFDFILLSVHEVEDRELWTQDFQRGMSRLEYNQRYYQELLELVRRYKNYSVLAHLDLISRYDEQGAYPFEELRPVIAQILRQVIADGKGIEVNTSSRRYGLGDLTPSRDILRLYRELGGRVLTIGSDSHKPADLGEDIAETMEELRAMGFTEFCTFSKMQPEFHLL